MGAGKGQLRRAGKNIIAMNQTSKSRNLLKEVRHREDWDKWCAWTESIDAQDVDTISFYFGSARSKDRTDLTDEEREFILNEIFMDAINNGAISFSTKLGQRKYGFSAPLRDALGNVQLLMLASQP